MTEEIALIETITAFLGRHQMAETTFGRRAMHNPNFLTDLKTGRSPTGKTMRKIKVWMKNEDGKLRRKQNAEQPKF